MCGRYRLKSAPEEYLALNDVRITPKISEELLRPRYNIAPTQAAPVVLARDGQLELDLFRWGLLPHWAKDKKIAARCINARADTVAEKPMFRAAFKSRRCLVPADGFYEWSQVEGGKIPYNIQLQEGRPFFFAGLWEERTEEDGSKLRTFSIITTDANPLVQPYHNRMPVILPPSACGRWLDEAATADELHGLLKPHAPDSMKLYAVSPAVNSPRNDFPELIEPYVPAP